MKLKWYQQLCLITILSLVHNVYLLKKKDKKNGKKRDCILGQWTEWSKCSHTCGGEATQRRSRVKTVIEQFGGKCIHSLLDIRFCNRFCNNGGTVVKDGCACREGFVGKCCESTG